MVAAVLALVERKPLGSVWQCCYLWSREYDLVETAAAGLMMSACRTAGWSPSLLSLLALMALVTVSYKVHGPRPQPALA